MINGALTAMVTPFRDGGFDEDAFRRLVEFQLSNGADGLVPCGTTGEAPCLGPQEWEAVVRAAVEEAKGRVPVIAGAGSNSTAASKEKARRAKDLGADAALVVTPYYNKPTQDGLFAHFREVASAGIPVILYNVPSRTGVSFTAETVWRLSKVPGIIGIKEASADLRLASDIIEKAGSGFSVLSGDDFTALPLWSVGGKGVISVVSNVAPKDVADMWDAFNAGHLEEARRLHFKLQPLCRALFLEANPIPVKAALAIMGKASGEMRLPLSEPSGQNRLKIEAALREYGLKE